MTAACPLKQDLAALFKHEKGMLRAMRRLQRDLERCQECDERQRCPLIENLNAQVAQAVQEISEEYDLAGKYRAVSDEL